MSPNSPNNRTNALFPISYSSEDGNEVVGLIPLLSDHPEIVSAIQDLDETLVTATEYELSRLLGARAKDAAYGCLKIQFWQEFYAAIREERKMEVARIIYKLCSRQWFTTNILGDPVALAWIIVPGASELLLQKELVELGLRKLRQVMDLPLTIKTKKPVRDPVSGETTFSTESKPNTALIKEILSIIKLAQDRIYGSVVHKQQIQSKSLSVTTSDPRALNADVEIAEIEEIETRLRELKEVTKDLRTLEAGVVKDDASDKGS